VRGKSAHSLFSSVSTSKAPCLHPKNPNPLPEGEGTMLRILGLQYFQPVTTTTSIGPPLCGSAARRT